MKHCPACGHHGYRVTTRDEGFIGIEHYICTNLDCTDRKEWLDDMGMLVIIDRDHKPAITGMPF